ncbi:MAG: hypothetical protein WCP35_19150 [Verrucomicrobiota bacterium]
MFEDPIVEEIRRYRKEHAAKYGNDIHRIFEALREAEKKHPERLVHFGPKLLSDRKPQCVAEEPAPYKTTPETTNQQP